APIPAIGPGTEPLGSSPRGAPCARSECTHTLAPTSPHPPAHLPPPRGEGSRVGGGQPRRPNLHANCGPALPVQSPCHPRESGDLRSTGVPAFAGMTSQKIAPPTGPPPSP